MKTINETVGQMIKAVLLNEHTMCGCTRELEAMATFMGAYNTNLVYCIEDVGAEIKSFVDSETEYYQETASLDDYIF